MCPAPATSPACTAGPRPCPARTPPSSPRPRGSTSSISSSSSPRAWSCSPAAIRSSAATSTRSSSPPCAGASPWRSRRASRRCSPPTRSPASRPRASHASRSASTGPPLQLNTSLTRTTVAALPAMLAHVAAIAPVLWSVFFVVPVGRATAAQQLDAAECERIFHVLADWSAATGIAVKTTAAPAFRRVLAERAARAAGGCAGRRPPLPAAVTDGRGIVFVSHTGAIQPSGFLPLVAGNVRRERLATLYRTGALFAALRDDRRLEGKCGRCAFRRLCGGSRARAFATTGDAFAEDPACVYQPPP